MLKPVFNSSPTTAPPLLGSTAKLPQPALSNPHASCHLLSRAVSARENHTARSPRVQRETFHTLALVSFELNRDLLLIHLKFIGRRCLEPNPGKISEPRETDVLQ